MKAALTSMLVVLVLAGTAAADPPRVKITEEGNHLHIEMNGSDFTDYWFGTRDDRPYVRPFFYPIFSSDGVNVVSDQFVVKGGDHPHHQGMWVGHENVNGVNHWLVKQRQPAPKQEHLAFDKIAADGFVERLQWDDLSAKALLLETRTVQFVSYDDGSRAIDLTVALTPASISVTLADSKDAGLCSVRVAKAISNTVTITNSAGQTKEQSCWGKPADWCDETGIIDGKLYGVTMFDSPRNPRHPTCWHVRQYGLMAANPFGLHEFEPKIYPAGTGDFQIAPGTTATFHYRVLIHKGDIQTATIDQKYKEFANSLSRQ